MLNNCLNFIHLFKNAFFGPHCILCRQSLAIEPVPAPSAFCQACYDQLSWHDGHSCPQCGMPSWGEVCGLCLNKPPHFEQTIAAFDYDFPIDRLISAYKYQFQLQLATPLSQALIQAVRQKLTVMPDYIIAMPLHPMRIAERGFNQSLELAKILSLEMYIPISHACLRIINTPPQAKLSQAQRIRNIRGAFHCAHSLEGLNIAIVDDVMTTGASLNELARQLKQRGAAHVQCWVIARTQHHDQISPTRLELPLCCTSSYLNPKSPPIPAISFVYAPTLGRNCI